MNTNVDLLLENSTLADGSTAFVGITGGKIASISRERHAGAAAERLDLNGALLTPSLIDGHMHLDTTLFGNGAWHPHRPCRDGFDVAERLQIQKDIMAIADPVGHRAARLVEQAVARGTGCIRTHVEIDSHYGLSHFEATLETRERYREAVNIQIVGLARGMLLDDRVRDLMAEALRNGADVVGGLDPAGFEGDIQLHLDTTFAMADQHGVGIDLHLHDGGSLGLYELSQIAERSRALGMQGRVSVSHAYALGEMPWDAVAPVAAQLAEAGVSIMTNERARKSALSAGRGAGGGGKMSFGNSATKFRCVNGIAFCVRKICLSSAASPPAGSRSCRPGRAQRRSGLSPK